MKINELNYENVHGSGSFAVIQRYKDPNTKIKYAVKKLKRDYVGNPDYVERFIKEIEYTKRLSQSKNIIEIFGEEINHETKSFYYIMPFANYNLNEYITNNNSDLTFQQRIYIFDQILDAIKYAHGRNIWHRDLTPTNTLVFFDENKKEIIKVCDFGLGKDPESLSRMANSSIAGHGQWMYVDPDQLDSLKNGNNLSDVFSLGKILYFVLTGKNPIVLKNCKFEKVIEKAINKEYSSILDFEEDFNKMRGIYVQLENSEPLTLLEYIETNIQNLNWNEFHRISLRAATVEHYYDDFMAPAMKVLNDATQVRKFLDTIGSDDQLFINKFVEALHHCHSSIGWPFNQLDNFTRFLVRFAHESTSQDVKLMCLKEAWYIAAVCDQWSSQDLLITTLEKHHFSENIDEGFASYILEVGKSFSKLERLNLNSVKSHRIKRALGNLRENT
ncbi:protein kinase domain-containing protein [Virgibacillus salexigens]|uniref:protein kinase domain-containing protein n=1 Tax=Virgibacillus salexigens TaxID=61016 RepID=UPI00190B40E2|nr:protein kinase [Virgibacillus salexigens]